MSVGSSWSHDQQFLRKHKLYDGQPPGLLATRRFGMCDFVDITLWASERGRGAMPRLWGNSGCDQIRPKWPCNVCRLVRLDAASGSPPTNIGWVHDRECQPQLIFNAETAPNVFTSRVSRSRRPDKRVIVQVSDSVMSFIVLDSSTSSEGSERARKASLATQ